jgi:hypothetical protein
MSKLAKARRIGWKNIEGGKQKTGGQVDDVR